MPVHNSDIANAFDEIADLLEIQGENPFRIRAYRNAARVAGGWPSSLASLLEQNGELPKMPGIGSDLAGKISEFIQTRKMPLLEEVRKSIPEGLRALLRIPGLGPKRVQILQKELRIRSLADLDRAVRSGKVREISGFGPKTEQRILRELDKSAQEPGRWRLAVADQIVAPLLDFLRKVPGVRQPIAAGSYRRRKETVGDIDILVAAESDPEVIRQSFTSYEDSAEILASGETRSTIVLRSGIHVDLRIVPPESYGSALHYFTGSKAHNIAVRAMGVKRGLKINEYGVFRGNRRIGGKTEEEIFAAVGLPFIPPELRENGGEIEAAQKGMLPKLVELSQIRGDLHSHTKLTDGRETLEAMVDAARERGYEYLAISDHTKHLSVARGLSPARLRRQMRAIDALNEKLKGFRVLKSSEVDILEDGTLDLPDEVLRELDLTVCSIHFKFDLPRRKQTERIIRAMDHPCFKILGHPTGRLIGAREPMDIDLDRILNAAKERGCFLEVNSQPDRLDLADVYCKLAREYGVQVAISTDAHSRGDLELMRLGVSQARRGWLEAKDVLNTRSWAQLQKLLRRS